MGVSFFVLLHSCKAIRKNIFAMLARSQKSLMRLYAFFNYLFNQKHSTNSVTFSVKPYLIIILKGLKIVMMTTIFQSSTKYGSLGFFSDVQKVMINVLTARKLNKCRVKSNSRLVGMVIWVVKFSREGCNVK